MNFFYNLRLKSFRKKVKNIAQQNSTEHMIKGFEKAKKVALLFDSSNSTITQQVLSYKKKLLAKGVSVKLLAIHQEKEAPETLAKFAYNPTKESSWTLIPKGEIIEEFINFPADILINFTPKSSPAIEYICTITKATFRIGRNPEDSHFHDLIIESSSNNANDFIGQIEFFLRNFEKNIAHTTSPKPNNKYAQMAST